MKRGYGTSMGAPYGRRVRARYGAGMGGRRLFRRRRRTLKRRRTVLSKAYHCQYNKRRYGRRIRQARKTDRIIKSATENIRFYHQRMSDWSAAGSPAGTALVGARYLGFAGNRDLNVNYTTYPGMIISLHSIRQGTADSSAPVYGIVKDETTGQYRYWSEYGYAPDGVTPEQQWQYEDVSRGGPGGTETRRNGFCNWTRLRLQFYGKTKSPTMIRVRLIKFIDEMSTPDSRTYTSGYSDMLPDQICSQFDQIFKPLVSNTIAGQINFDKRAFRTIKTWAINIDPTETDQNDTDVYRRVVDIFNRWNKVFSFQKRNTSADMTVDVDNPLKQPTLQNAFGAYTNPFNAGYHIFIDSFQPIKKNQVPASTDPPIAADPFNQCTPAETASVDWKLQSSWGNLNN